MDDDDLVLVSDVAQPIPVTPAPERIPPEEPVFAGLPVDDRAPEADPMPEPEPSSEVPPIDASEPGTEVLAGIHGDLAALLSETGRLNDILDRMHTENERLRRGEAEQLLQPLLRDLIKLADDWAGMARVWSGKESAKPSDVAGKCEQVADDASLILERHGVERFSPEPGDAYERKLHRAVGTTRTSDASLESTVSSTRRVGYYAGEKVLRFAEVLLYTHVPGTGTDQESAQ